MRTRFAMPWLILIMMAMVILVGCSTTPNAMTSDPQAQATTAPDRMAGGWPMSPAVVPEAPVSEHRSLTMCDCTEITTTCCPDCGDGTLRWGNYPFCHFPY